MRHILTSVVLVVLLFPSLALGETVKFEDLVERGEVYYKKFTDIPFSGTVTGNPQGKLKNGIKDGPWVSYHDNGQLWSKGTYKDGKKKGPWVDYYKDGTVDYGWTGTFKDGVKVK
jgi:antitoxin component YwqK of YwqJK toxin-antitoxin module